MGAKPSIVVDKKAAGSSSLSNPATLRTRERLRLTTQFLAIRRRGAWARGPVLSLGALPTRRDTSRLGVRIQRGLRGSIARNRAKRLLREAYRKHKNRLAGGHDLLAILQRIDKLSLRLVEDELLRQCQKLHLILR